MLTLAAADTLAGVASVASKLTCTIFGMELVGAAETYKVLDQRQLAAAAATIYTVPASTTSFIRTITVVNTDTAAQTFQLFRGGTAQSNALTGVMQIPAGGQAVYEDGEGWRFYDSNGNFKTTVVAATGILRGIINVLDYGAKGDGSTDDRASIQAAIAAAGTSGVSGRGVDVYFPPGVYAIGATLTMPYNNVMLIGHGWQSTIIYATFTTTDVLQIGDGTSKGGCGIREISVWGNAARTTGAQINVNAMNDCRIEQFVINNCFQGILVQGASIKVWITKGEINNIGVTTGVGIQVTNGAAGDTYVTDIVMSNNPANKPAAGIQVTQTGHMSILRCNITSAIVGLSVNPGSSQDVSYLFIDHSLFDSCGTHGAKFAPTNATGRIRSVISVNSWYSGSVTTGGAGIEFAGVASSTIDGLSFIGCRLLNNFNHGVFINYASAQNISFTDCTVAGNGQQTVNTYDGFNIIANVNNISILNCGICQQGTAGNQQRYAINIAAGTSGGIQILDNQCSPNLSAGTGSFMNLGALTGTNNNIRGNSPQMTGSGPITIPAQVATSGTGETLILAAKLSANSVKIGDTFEIETHGISSSTGTLIFKIRVGAVGTVAGDGQIAWTSITSAAQVANQRAGFKALLTIRSLTTVQSEGVGYAQAAVLPSVVAAVATATIASNAIWFIDITCTCSIGTWTAQEATVTPL